MQMDLNPYSPSFGLCWRPQQFEADTLAACKRSYSGLVASFRDHNSSAWPEVVDNGVKVADRAEGDFA